MTLTHQEVFERYIYATAIKRDPDMIADLFTEDGVFEAPLVPPGHRLPRRLEGRTAIRAGVADYHRDPAYQGTVDASQSRCVLHDTTDPDVFIAEIDALLKTEAGQQVTWSFVRIYRLREGKIQSLRDYFASPGA